MKHWRKIYILLAIFITTISLGALLLKIENLPPVNNWWPTQARPEYLVASIISAVFQFTVAALAYHSALNTRDPHRRIRFIGVFLLAQAGKYAPGRVWSPFIQKLTIGNEESLTRIIFANILVFACVVISQLITAFTALLYFSIGLGAAAAALLLIPAGTGLAFRLFSKTPLKNWDVTNFFSQQDSALRFLCNFLLFFFSGLMTWFTFYCGWLGYAPEEGLALIGATSLSLIAGYLSVLPAGLGVREAVFIMMKDMPWPLPTEAMTTLAIQSRAFLFLVDGLIASLGVLILILFKRREA